MNPAQEEMIIEWIVDLHRDGVQVSASIVKIKALEVAAEIGIPDGAFAASKQWRKGFLARHALSFRVRTHQGHVSVADGQQTTVVFAVRVRAVMEVMGMNVVINADQKVVTFKLPP
ncbi:hypothetical protein PINS_up013572 [Pythium insidiosum]|nr:hypothetical protein PINS_up013572 [Pythium insidiosum]